MTDYTCPTCHVSLNELIFIAEEECVVCGLAFDARSYVHKKQVDRYEKGIRSIKRWLKSADMSTETKDELCKRLHKI